MADNEYTEDPRPMVFITQPQHPAVEIEAITTPERLDEWERQTIEWVRFAASTLRNKTLPDGSFTPAGGTCSFTISGDPRVADDSIRD